MIPSEYQPPLPLERIILKEGVEGAGDRMELDVLFVGAGPAGLAGAIELKVSSMVPVGSMIVAGAMNTCALCMERFRAEVAAPVRRVYLLGFSSTASSLLELISRNRPDLLADIAVIDFNPQVNERLRRRGVLRHLGIPTEQPEKADLADAPEEASQLFAECLEDVLAPFENQRYVVPRYWAEAPTGAPSCANHPV